VTLRFPEPDDVELLQRRAGEALGQTDGPDLQLSRPLRVTYWQYDGSARPREREERRWHCIAGSDNEPVAVVELIAENDDYTVVSVSRGTLASDLNTAIAYVDDELDDDFVVEVLHIPELYFSSLQLTSESRRLIVPLPRADLEQFQAVEPIDIETLDEHLARLDRPDPTQA